MAAEVQFLGPGTGRTCYTNVRNRTSGFIWNGSAFETYSSNSGNQASYAVDAAEQGGSNVYTVNFPSTIPAGVYDVVAKEKLTVPYLESDPLVAAGEVQWNGSITPPLSDFVTSGQLGRSLPVKLTRGQMIQNFGVYFKSSVDHITPLVSGVVSGQIARDGGSFVALQSGSFSEVGLGWYNLMAFTSGDLDAGTAKVHFTAVGISGGTADPVPISFVLQRVSGV